LFLSNQNIRPPQHASKIGLFADVISNDFMLPLPLAFDYPGEKIENIFQRVVKKRP
jgi:hypothetical protein